MKAKISSIFWGVIFILLGGALLAERLGYYDFEKISDNFWVYLFAGLSLIFFFSYALDGVRKWGWLFPALISAALALTIWMAEKGLGGANLGTPILFSIALPFYVGFALNRRNWGLLIPAWIMTIIALVTLLVEQTSGNLVGALFLISAAIPFLIVYLINRKLWWALIPTWVLFILGLITLLAGQVKGDIIGAIFMYSIALPFLVVYLRNRAHRWALIPAAVLLVIGTIPLVTGLISGEAVGAVVMFLFAAPFFVVYFWSKNNWWALIPAGIFASIGVVVILGLTLPRKPIFEGINTGILFLGFGLTFGGLWLRRKTQPTRWARYPALGLLIAAVIAFLLGGTPDLFWPVAIMAAGIAMVVLSLLRRKPKKAEDLPQEQK